MSKRKQKRCRICKKRPVWRGGDVKNPGPFCKRCYHKDVWPDRPSARKDSKAAPVSQEHDYDHCPSCGIEVDVCGCGNCPGCGCDLSYVIYTWLIE